MVHALHIILVPVVIALVVVGFGIFAWQLFRGNREKLTALQTGVVKIDC
jgi:hypothetical protein